MSAARPGTTPLQGQGLSVGSIPSGTGECGLTAAENPATSGERNTAVLSDMVEPFVERGAGDDTPSIHRSRSPLWRNPRVVLGAAVIGVIVVAGLLAAYLGTHDPLQLRPRMRLRPPSDAAWLGTDQFGRDIFSRVVYGARVSLIVGLAVSFVAIVCGLTLGLLAGYIRVLDAILMRVMDAIMAIPSILLAIAMVTLSGAGLPTVIVAITIPEIPRIARVVRGVVLTVREEPYVEAAIGLGTPCPGSSSATFCPIRSRP